MGSPSPAGMKNADGLFGRLPMELQRKILGPIDLELVQKGDRRLTDYLCRHRMLKAPQSVMCWGIYRGDVWLLDRVCAAGWEPSEHVERLGAFMFGAVTVNSKPTPRGHVLVRHLQDGRLREALEVAEPDMDVRTWLLRRAASTSMLLNRTSLADTISFMQRFPAAAEDVLQFAVVHANLAVLRNCCTLGDTGLLAAENAALFQTAVEAARVPTIQLFLNLGHDMRTADWSKVWHVNGHVEFQAPSACREWAGGLVQEQDEVAQWMHTYTEQRTDGYFTSSDAFRHFANVGGTVPQRVFKHRLVSVLKSHFHAQKKIEGVNRSNVFINMVIQQDG